MNGHWLDEKLRIVETSPPPGMRVSSVTRKQWIDPEKVLYTRRRYNEIHRGMPVRQGRF